jgi:hypothetical protein
VLCVTIKTTAETIYQANGRFGSKVDVDERLLIAIKRHKPVAAIGSGKILRKQTLRFLQVLAIGQVNIHQ